MNLMPKSPPGPPLDGPGAEPVAARRSLWRWLGPAASVVLFTASLVVLWMVVSEVDAAELRAAFIRATDEQMTMALAFTALSYLLLTCYDALALRQLKLQIPYRTTALASFTSYAVSFNLGFPLITAGTVRYWIYSPKGMRASRVASLTVIAGLTFWLGMGLVLGWSLLREPESLAALKGIHPNINRLLGVAAFAVVFGYAVWVALGRRSVTIQGWRLELPGFRLTCGQALIGAADVCAGAAVLYWLLPAPNPIGYEVFLAVYVFAVMLGVASHAPGGLGVFEATILLALSGLPRESVLGALLIYRLIYYLLPFVLALALLGGYEILRRIRLGRVIMASPDEDERP
jgi:uncharacterized membrane protein YbhN (UPF0104 family)